MMFLIYIFLLIIFIFIAGNISGLFLNDIYKLDKGKTRISRKQAFKMLKGYRIVESKDKSLKVEIRHSWIVRKWKREKYII